MLQALRQLHSSVYVLSLASGVIMTGFMMLLPLLPLYTEELGFGEYEIGLLVAAFFIGRVLFQFPLGILSDHIGRRRIIWAALILFSVATAAYALTTEVAFMVSFRLVQGIASSGFVVGSQSFINDCTPVEFRGLANGVMSSAINTGVIAGPVLGGTFSQAFGLRAPFWTGGALGLLCFFLTLTLPKLKEAHGPSTEWAGRLPHVPRYRHILATVLCLPAFLLSSVHFLYMMGLGILITAVPVLTAELLSWSPNDIALALALSGGVAAVSSPYLGRMADRSGRMWVMSGGLALAALEGFVIFIHPGTMITMLALAIGGASAPAYFNALYSLEGDVTRPQERGALTGFVGSFGEWGSIIGSSLLTPLVWRNVSVGAPMAMQATLLVAAFLLAVTMKTALDRRAAGSGRGADA